jgi:hypothetical protein
MWLTATAPMAQVLLPRLKFATFASGMVICYGLGKLAIGPLLGTILDSVNHGKAPANRDYHLIYLWTCIFITASLVATIVVYKYFMAYGGQKHYVPPGDEQKVIA